MCYHDLGNRFSRNYRLYLRSAIMFFHNNHFRCFSLQQRLIWCFEEDGCLIHFCHSIQHDKCRWSTEHGRNCGHFITCLTSLVSGALKGEICLLRMSVPHAIFIGTEAGITTRMSTSNDMIFTVILSIYLYIALSAIKLYNAEMYIITGATSHRVPCIVNTAKLCCTIKLTLICK